MRVQFAYISYLLLAAQVIVVIVPVSILVERERFKLFSAYMQVPMKVLKKMQRASMLRLEELRQSEEDQPDKDSGDADAEAEAEAEANAHNDLYGDPGDGALQEQPESVSGTVLSASQRAPRCCSG